MGLLDGKVAIVTGAGRGIGRAEALLLAQEGASVVVNDLGGERDGSDAAPDVAEAVAAEIREAGGQAVADGHSVVAAEAAEAIVKTALERFGRLDILINNAGILRDKTLLKMTEAMWDPVVDVHLKGTFVMTQAAAGAMVKQREGGRIVNTTSVSGMLGNFGQSNYAAAKAGVYGLTRTAAIELQKHRLLVNAIAPIAKTRMTEDLPMFEGVETMTPQHIAPAALFLASGLSEDKTGFVLAVSGSRVYAFKVVESRGAFKEEGEPWTAEEISENWKSIVK
ncbi:MAG: SDR family NAD(P)-dependent oxidoreductase [Myxococcota bacterium]